MNDTERKMVDLLIDLRENYYFHGVKAEFEHEGARIEELMRLKEITMLAGLEITLKIGGCEAGTDLRMAKDIGVRTIVAPMVESSFAMQKFLSAVDDIYTSEELKKVRLLINIESVVGAQQFDSMLALSEFDRLSGVAIGRGDLTMSLGNVRTDIDNDQVFSICNHIFTETKRKHPDYECIVGAIYGESSFTFMERFAPGLVDGYERRKAMFNTAPGWERTRSEGFYKGLLFEKLWCANRSRYYGDLSQSDAAYLKALDKCMEHFKPTIVGV